MFLIASRFLTPLLACSFFSLRATVTSSSKLFRDQTSNPTSSTNPTPKGRIRRSSKHKVENSNFEENPLPPEIPMAENQTMAQLLQAPTDGYEDAIFIPEISATNFELKHGLINLVQNKQFFRHEKEDPHAHLRYFNKITSTSKSKVRQTRAKAVVAKVNSNSSTLAVSSDVAELKDMLLNRIVLPAVVLTRTKTVSGNVYQDNIQEYVSQAAAANYSQGNIGFRPQMVANQIRPPGFSLVQNTQNNFNRRNNFNQNRGGNFNQSNFNQIQLHRPQVNQPLAYQALAYQALVSQTQSVSQNDFKRYIKANDAVLRNIQSQGQRSGTLPGNAVTNAKEDSKGISTRSGVAYQGPTIPTPSKVAKQGTEVTKDQVKTSNSQRMDECLALADLSASINLMPLFVWKGLSLLELTPTCMTLELADRTESKPIGIAKDVKVKVGVFHFPADFVVVDFELDPRVPLILGRCFLKIGRALIDVHKGELTLRIGHEAITYNLDQTSKYSANHDQMTTNKIDVTDEACEEYSQEVLGFSDVTASDSPTPSDDPIVSTTSSKLTPFGDRDFLLFEEADAFLGLEDDPDSSELDPSYYDLEGDILLLEAILNSDPSPPLPNHEQSVPSFKEELKAYEAKTIKSFIDEPPEVELKDLPPHLECTFLEGDNKLPVIIAKELRDDEKSALIKVLKSHKRAIAWKLSDIQGINPEFCTHKILIEEDYKAAVQHQRRVNPKIHDVIKKEVEKLLDAGLIYPISDSPWVSPVHCVPKKGGFTVVANEENELIPTCLVTEWRTMEVFMDDFSVFRNSFKNCLSGLDKMLQRCEDTKLCLNWEKSHFMVKKGIVLGHKISKNGIEVDKAKIDVIAKLPHPTTVKGAVLGQRHEKHFWPIYYASKTLTNAESNYTTTKKKMLAVVYAFEKFRSYLIMNKCIVHTDHSALKYLFPKKDAKAGLLRWVLLLQEFHFDVIDTKGAENLAADHLSRLENPYENVLDPKEINDKFPLETLGKNRASWSDKLDDALWAFRITYKTPIGYTPYKLVYGKACHLPIELEHKAYWAPKQTNFDLSVAGDHRKIQSNELNELCDHAYENSLIYKEKTKRIHDSKIKNCVFNVGDQVLLFNSRLKIFSGKLKSHWSGPFTIAKVFPYGTVELSQANMPNFKVNGHRIKHYFGGDVPQLVVLDLQTFPLDQP
nr:DNA-directed DNA polymerase [Tanacetum cinerariifolium]